MALHTETVSAHTAALVQPRQETIAPGQLLIGSRWVNAQAGEVTEVSDPTTEDTITRTQKASAADANRAINAAYAAFENGPWGCMRHEDRAKNLFRMADPMDDRADEFAIREAMDTGMPCTDFRSIIMPHCSGPFHYFGTGHAHMDGICRTSHKTVWANLG